MFSCATIVGPRSHSHALPLAWSKCQWVLIRCVRGSGPRSARAAAIWGRETAMPASTSTFPSRPAMTATLPPEPSSATIPPRSRWTVIGAFAASALIVSTMPSASA